MKVKEFLQNLEISCEIVYYFDNARLYENPVENGFSCCSLDVFFTYDEIDEMQVYAVGVQSSTALRLDIM